jgi:hypothetical protein
MLFVLLDVLCQLGMSSTLRFSKVVAAIGGRTSLFEAAHSVGETYHEKTCRHALLMSTSLWRPAVGFSPLWLGPKLFFCLALILCQPFKVI